MTINEIEQTIKNEEYDFLREHPNLGDNICLLGLSGSYAYGLNTDSSDLDIRGITLDLPKNILLNHPFKSYRNSDLGVTIFGFSKAVNMLSNGNLGMIEMLGLKPEHYLKMNDFGRLLLNNKHLFITKRIYHSFYNYAKSLLLDLKRVNGLLDENEVDEHILTEINSSLPSLIDTHFGKNIYAYNRVYKPSGSGPILVDVDINECPLSSLINFTNDISGIERKYKSSKRRNKYALEKGKLEKHASTIIRFLATLEEALLTGEVVTYRDKERKLLMSIRQGFFTEDGLMTPYYFEIAEEYLRKVDEAYNKSKLPDSPDMCKINELKSYVNQRIIMNAI